MWIMQLYFLSPQGQIIETFCFEDEARCREALRAVSDRIAATPLQQMTDGVIADRDLVTMDTLQGTVVIRPSMISRVTVSSLDQVRAGKKAMDELKAIFEEKVGF